MTKKIVCTAPHSYCGHGLPDCVLIEETTNDPRKMAEDIARIVFQPCLRSNISRTEACENGIELYMSGYMKGIAAERKQNVQAIMDLLLALRHIKGKVTNKDLVKLAKRIRGNND